MKKHINILATALLLATTASCVSETDMPSPEMPDGLAMRELTVTVAPVSRTTIEYENSDFSHLVWCDGDEVAYVTDVNGDTFRTAVISHNTFRAEVPETATSNNKLIIIYPAGDHAGKSLSDTQLATVNPTVTDIDSPFDGSRLPLSSVTPVPSSKSVTADFEVMASVVRLCISGGQSSEELLESVTLSADQSLTGTYKRSYYGWFLDGGDRSISMNIEGENRSLTAAGGKSGYIYFVVPRNQYTGVGLSITTDGGTYTFADGEMDLAQDGRTLYRLDLTLGEPEPVKQPMFRKITSLDDVTTGENDKYLIVCEEKSYVYSDYNSNNYYEGIPVTIGPDGIDAACSEATGFQFSIFHYTGENAHLYYLKTDQYIGRGYYIGMMPNFPGTPGKIYYDSSPDYQENSWDISFDADGNLKLKGNPKTQDVAGDVFLGFYRPGNHFATYGQDASSDQIIPLQLYKRFE